MSETTSTVHLLGTRTSILTVAHQLLHTQVPLCMHLGSFKCSSSDSVVSYLSLVLKYYLACLQIDSLYNPSASAVNTEQICGWQLPNGQFTQLPGVASSCGDVSFVEQHSQVTRYHCLLLIIITCARWSLSVGWLTRSLVGWQQHSLKTIIVCK